MTAVVALVPAHDEAAGIGACLAALAAQTRRPDRVVVIADRCTDDTAGVARSYGAEVLETAGNAHAKAGALNVALGGLDPDGPGLLPALDRDDVVLVVDADSHLDPGFVATALDHLDGDVGLGGVGGTFLGQPGGGFVGWCQRQEYERYKRDVRRLRGRALVLTGTATVLRVQALREVLAGRADGWIPGQPGAVYDVRVLTEDSELSLALMHLGWRILAPAGCTLTTEVMSTWRALARQRLRWKRGALENLGDYGWTRVTARYWGRQALGLAGVLVTAVYLASLGYGAVAGMTLHPLWVAVTAVFVVERVVTVQRRGWVHATAAAALLPEMVYDVCLQAVQARAYADAALGRARSW
jgi:biofilm PGA synthesis N-glycosyltransferase PgaC